MATTRTTVQTLVSVGMADGATNTHVRKQIQRLRLSKGWTERDLEQAAGMPADSLGGLETGIRRINLETLQQIVDALDVDITDVWPVPKFTTSMQSRLPFWRASDPIHLSRLAEVQSLTGAEASCMFIANGHHDLAQSASGEIPAPVLQSLSAINVGEGEKVRLSRRLLQGKLTSPWVAYLHCENGRCLYLCLKGARVSVWAERFIERCLSAWLTAAQ